MMLLASDPGLGGAIAHYDVGRGVLDVMDMPTITHELSSGKLRAAVDEDELIAVMALFADQGYADLFLEKVGGLPGQNAARAFNFGGYTAAVRIAAKASGIRVHEIPPGVWKTAMRAPKNKDAARARATALLPQCRHLWPLKKHDGRAEACLLALYGARQLKGA